MNNRLAESGMTGLVSCARRGDFTMPAELLEAYTAYENALAANSKDEGLSVLVDDVFRAVNRAGGADELIKAHIQPAMAAYIEDFSTDAALVAGYTKDTQITLGLLGEPDEVREAYIRFVSSHPRYASIRAGWEILRRMSYAGQSSEPGDVRSLRAEVRNIDSLVSNWELCNTGADNWPWIYQVHHIRLAWIVTNGGELWCPTAGEQSENYTVRAAVKSAA